MKLVHILFACLLFGCDGKDKLIPSGDCSQGDFECGEGLECTSQLTLEGPRYGCTPADEQPQPPPSVAVQPDPGGTQPQSGGSDLSPPPTAGEEFVSDFTPAVGGQSGAQPADDIDRQVAQECLDIFECFGDSACDQFMMLEEEQECVDSCIVAASAPAQIAFANFANCLRLNCITAGGELMGEECIIESCFYQADACNLIVRQME